jgi:hypothetical protein
MTDLNVEHFDITPLMASYFDIHMVFPLLDHLREVNIFYECFCLDFVHLQSLFSLFYE